MPEQETPSRDELVKVMKDAAQEAKANGVRAQAALRSQDFEQARLLFGRAQRAAAAARDAHAEVYGDG